VPESEIDRGSQTLIVSLRIAPGAFWRDLFLTTSRLTAFFNKFLDGIRSSFKGESMRKALRGLGDVREELVQIQEEFTRLQKRIEAVRDSVAEYLSKKSYLV
jgi:uncharacterized protein YlxW (UPF0749 family)